PVNDYIPGKDEMLATHPVDRIQELNRWIEKLCAENGYEYVDFYTAVADSAGKLRREYTHDGMHCNPAGYTAWKPLVAGVLKKWQVIP
ncbi:MAG TPA: GDSL-type esterase/lipase family protein, partial [bacterium]|nr:GDSL-type esterase/lipase family protein [bacterium]